jgi:hypothetical protein
MSNGLKLKLWGPNGEEKEFFLCSREEVAKNLVLWATEIECNVADLDYQVDGGLRIMGEGNPYAGEVD